MTEATARLNFRGEQRIVRGDAPFLFGRGDDNDISVLDDLVHRQFGQLFHRGDLWWLRNVGSELTLEMRDEGSRSWSLVAPGSTVAVSFTQAEIHFHGRSDYVIHLEIEDPEYPLSTNDLGIEPSASGDTKTLRHLLRGGQRLLVVAMAEEQLREPQQLLRIPPYKELCERLDVGSSAIDSRLTRIAEKFVDKGLMSAEFDRGDRMRTIVEVAITYRIISTDDLDLLALYPWPKD